MLQQKEIDAIQEVIASERRPSIKPVTFVALVVGALTAAGGIAMVFLGVPDGTYPGTFGVALVIAAGLSIPAPRRYDSEDFRSRPLPSKAVNLLSRDLTKASLREMAALQQADEDHHVRIRHLIGMLERHYADKRNAT